MIIWFYYELFHAIIYLWKDLQNSELITLKQKVNEYEY